MHGILIQQIPYMTKVYRGIRFNTAEINCCYQISLLNCFVSFSISTCYPVLKILRKTLIIKEMESDRYNILYYELLEIYFHAF